jgi:hypothetical protein
LRQATIHSILRRRHQLLQTLQQKSVKNALSILVESRNMGATVDYLKILASNPKILNLDTAVDMLPLVEELLFAIYEEYHQLTKLYYNILQDFECVVQLLWPSHQINYSCFPRYHIQ